jgi:2'-5' RNA ligase
MRLFISCPLPEKVCAYLHHLASHLPSATLTIPKQFDLTLKFLGEVSDDSVQKIIEAISSICFAPFTMTLGSLGSFSDRIVKVVWVGIVPCEPLMQLQSSIDRVLCQDFLPVEKFVPHITLARVRKIKDRATFLSQLHSMHVDTISWEVDRCSLTQSVLNSKGAQHFILHEFLSDSK